MQPWLNPPIPTAPFHALLSQVFRKEILAVILTFSPFTFLSKKSQFFNYLSYQTSPLTPCSTSDLLFQICRAYPLMWVLSLLMVVLQSCILPHFASLFHRPDFFLLSVILRPQNRFSGNLAYFRSTSVRRSVPPQCTFLRISSFTPGTIF